MNLRRRNWILSALALAALLSILPAKIAAAQQATPAERTRVIGFITDFDVRDDAIGICKAVMIGIAPDVRIIDLTHQVTPYDIAEGARFIAGSAPYFPKDAVFVGVIDPGVGSTRKAIIAKSKVGQFFVVPDNGLLTLVQDRDGIEVAREITNPDWMIGTKLSSTFHGRDIFSPAGAHLARGDDWTQAGPELDISKLVRLDIHYATIDDNGMHAEVIGTDGPFGNLGAQCARRYFSRNSAINSVTLSRSPSMATTMSSLSTKLLAMCPWASRSSSSIHEDASRLASISAISLRPIRFPSMRICSSQPSDS